jgi:AbrB family looped-hinge helix DNA binding protein
METAKMSTKNQIVVPKQMREALGVKAGDEIMFIARQGFVYLLPKPKSFVEVLKGKATEGLRYPRNYLRKERKSW